MIPRSLLPWAPSDTPTLNLMVAKRAFLDIGILEIPPGSNRSGRIDEYNLAAGVPVGSFWCASAVAAWFREAGAKVPISAASCDAWMNWAKAQGTWKDSPAIGRAVVYGTHAPLDAHHIGVVVRISPILCSVEGNTTLGGEFNRNGVATDFKTVAKNRVLGYIEPAAG